MEKITNEQVEAAWKVYHKAFLEIPYSKQRKFIKSCEHNIKQLERRIARKKKLEAHQILNDMEELHKRAADIGYTVSNRDHKLRNYYKHVLKRLIQLDLSFLRRMGPSSSFTEILKIFICCFASGPCMRFIKTITCSLWWDGGLKS